jgi:hypothetical protein
MRGVSFWSILSGVNMRRFVVGEYGWDGYAGEFTSCANKDVDIQRLK